MISEELGIRPESIAADDNLMALGMHSLALMKLAGRLRKAGHQIHYSAMALHPTLDGWAELLGVSPAEPAAIENNNSGADDGDEFGLATMQHAYWIGRQQGQRLGGVAAHLYVEFDGAGIDANRLERALRRTIARHEMLRVAFGDNGTQRILDWAPAGVWSATDLRHLTDEADLARRLDDVRDAKSHQQLDVSAGQVIDVAATLLPGGAHRIHVDVDMLAADAMSYRRILADLAEYYIKDSDNALPPIGYSYREYLAARRRSAADDRHQHWWQERIPDLPDVPDLPTVNEAERADPTRSIRRHHWFDAGRKRRFEEVAFGHGITPAVLLATLFCEVIAGWSATQRFLLNIPLFHREPIHPEVDQLVGDFTNSVLLDVDLTERLPLLERARQFGHALHTTSAHSDYEGLDVLRDLGRHRGSAVTPSVVFTSGLNLGELFSGAVTDVFGEPVWIISQGPQVDLDAQVAEVNGGMLLNWDVRRDALPAGVVDEMFARFIALLEAVVEPVFDWESARFAVPPPGQAQRRAAINAALAADLPVRTLHGRFFDLAQADPGRPALVWGAEATQTYGDLATDALRLAAALAAAGVGRSDRVAIHLPRGPRQVTAVLGVLAAGAAYVPVSVDLPAARRDAIVGRAGVRVVVTDGAGPGSALDLGTALAGDPAAAPVEAEPGDLAYVLFTSGSTGEPKGVEVPHAAAAATVDAIARHFDVGAEDRWIALSALEFDLSVLDIFGALGYGGSLACLDPATARDPDAWCAVIATRQVSIVNAAPGLIAMLADTAGQAAIAPVRLVLTGGDRVDVAVGRRLRAAGSGLRFVGLGGTTETAIHSTVCELTDDTPADWTYLPYGVPMDGVALRVVNGRGEDCPDWVPGEIWIGGRGVARGYHNDPRQTAERFLTIGTTRWYRTGDRGRYRPDGTVDFLGRRDHQIKLRGHRVELGEVEAALLQQPGVTAAVATVLGEPAARLVAAVAGTGPDGPAVRAAVAQVLPTYMVPDTVEVLDAMPVTRNGKTDRAQVVARLAAGTAERFQDAYVVPSDDVEAALEYIMSAVLEVERFGVETDFFEAGGNSLSATTFIAKVRGLLLARDAFIVDLFDARTVRNLARLLRGRGDVAQLERASALLLEVARASV
ncbi:amino acid adenylation domain-containing protein [Dactylosporangium sp. NPDC005572]|uniref:amino acid adenylation domain-containing protein n=1 Tax=Dactylosporangium sp. NPDC005572 TaxID=3156889 RepID=UPI0033B54B87